MRFCIHLRLKNLATTTTGRYNPFMDTPISSALRSLCEPRSEVLKADGTVNHNELARKCGVPQSTITRILRGEIIEPRRAIIEKLAVFFDVSLSEVRGEAPLSKVG